VSNQHHERVEAVVTAFREIVGESLSRQISDAHFRDLDRLIRELVSVELREAAERIEAVTKALKSETDVREMGL
jgi:hypothetical protein